MPGHRIGANKDRVDLLREPIRDRDKDWRPYLGGTIWCSKTATAWSATRARTEVM